MKPILRKALSSTVVGTNSIKNFCRMIVVIYSYAVLATCDKKDGIKWLKSLQSFYFVCLSVCIEVSLPYSPSLRRAARGRKTAGVPVMIDTE